MSFKKIAYEHTAVTANKYEIFLDTFPILPPKAIETPCNPTRETKLNAKRIFAIMLISLG